MYAIAKNNILILSFACSGVNLCTIEADAKHFPFPATGSAGVAGLLGAGFNSFRMWLWKVRASKTRHVARIFEVIGLACLCQICSFFFAWCAGKCIPKNPNWGHEYGMKFM
jgi:hypothetical protein